MAERGIWARVFMENDYSMENIVNMDDNSFQILVNFFLDSGLSPDEVAPPEFLNFINKNKSNHNNDEISDLNRVQNSGSLQYRFNFSSQGSSEQSATSLIQQDQNEQYAFMLYQMQQLENDSQLRKAEEERKIREEIACKRLKLDAAKKKISEKAHQIPKEPISSTASTNTDIISVSVILPGGRRILRHFSSSEPAENVYNWVACFEELFDPIDESLAPSNENNHSDSEGEYKKEANGKDDLALNDSDNDSNKIDKFLVDLEKRIENLGMPRDFQLIQPPQIIIDKTKTLADQKVGKRALFNVILDD